MLHWSRYQFCYSSVGINQLCYSCPGLNCVFSRVGVNCVTVVHGRSQLHYVL